MGQVKKIYMEVYEKLHIIDNLIELISSDIFEEVCNPMLIEDLLYIRNQIRHSIDSMTVYSIEPLNNYIRIESFYEIRSKLIALAEKSKIEKNVGFRSEARNMLSDLYARVHPIKNDLVDYILSEKNSSYNSESYYEQQIKEIQSQKEKLEKTLDTIKKINAKNQKEKEFQEREIQEKELQLQLAKQQIHNFQKELDEKKKQENAIEEWNKKIKGTFTELKKYLQPIKEEHSRLNKLFYGYLILSGVTILFVAIIEYIICSKFCANSSFPDWKNYLMLIHPIPISGALLCFFISQLNRAQRQLVILAKHIHEIEYIEGLLLSLNSLSLNIDESMKRINSAIDKLLNNHLSLGEKTRKYNEESIINEEHKDTVPIDIVLKILKEIKGLSNK